MALFSGITADTAKHLQLDAGAFLKNYDVTTDSWSSSTTKAKIIGATAGGGSFAAVPTIRSMEVDGKKGNVKGYETIDEWKVTLTANVKEITAETLKLALGTGNIETTTTPTGYSKVTADGEIADADYLTNIAWVGRISGSNNPVIILIKNALATSGLNLTVADKKEGVVAVTFTGHYTVDDLETPPFEIYYPTIT